MKLNNIERTIAINAFNAKGVVFINCNCEVTAREDEWTVDRVMYHSAYRSANDYIVAIEERCDYIENAVTDAAETYTY